MRFTVIPGLAALAALAAPAAAQTSTSCNPLNTTCPADPALGTSFNQTFNSDSNFNPALWNYTAAQVGYSDQGATFQIVKSGDSVTYLSSFYIFFGRVEIWMQAAGGTGIISSLVLLSDDLDEIDWEIMGGNSTYGENNYYGKGNQSERNAQYYPTSTPLQQSFHNYTLDWTAEKLEWHLDGQLVRTLLPEDAPGGYPQTPSFLKMGIWAGGDPSEPPGVIAWAGGETDYSQGPFTMIVANVSMTDYSTNATSYSYRGHSGTWQSIQVERTGQSVQAQIVNAPPAETEQQVWSGYSTGAKIAIIAVPSAVLAVLATVAGFCCVKQRAMGRRERALEDAMWEKQQSELSAYKRQVAATLGVANHASYQPIGP